MGDNIYPRRPQRRAHADAVEPGSQRRLLARRPAAPVPAADHGPDLRLRGGQRRGAVRAARRRCSTGRSASSRARKAHPAFGARHAALPAAGQPQGARLPARARGRGAAVRGESRRARAQPVELDLREFKGRVPVELLGNTPFPPIGELPYLLTLPPWGFYWFALTTDAKYPKWHEERRCRAEFPGAGDSGRADGRAVAARPGSDGPARAARTARARAARARGPAAISSRSSAGSPARARHRAARSCSSRASGRRRRQLAARDGARSTSTAAAGRPTSLPLALAWEQGDGARHADALLHCTLARVRQRARVGVLYDAFGTTPSAATCVAPCATTATRARPQAAALRVPADRAARRRRRGRAPSSIPRFEQSNTLVVIGDRSSSRAIGGCAAASIPRSRSAASSPKCRPSPHIAPLLRRARAS